MPARAADPRLDADVLLRAVIAEQAHQRALLERILRLLEQRETQPSTLSRADRARLARLLPAIVGAIGSELFHSAEIVDHESPALRVAAAGLSAKRVGRLLRRATGRPVDEWLVERCGIEAGVTLWRIVQIPKAA